MDRERITQAAKDFLTEYKGDSAAETPHAWPIIVTVAANDVAHKTSCYYDSESRNLTSGVSDYPPGTVYAIRRVTCSDGAGNMPAIGPMSIEDLNTWGIVQGFVQSNGAYVAGAPTQWIRLAENRIRVVPVPNYAAANGLIIEGLAYPGDRWPEDHSECPLPLHYHYAVAIRAAVIRAGQFPDDENKARVAAMAAVYETEIEAAKLMAGQTAQIQAQMDISPPAMGGI